MGRISTVSICLTKDSHLLHPSSIQLLTKETRRLEEIECLCRVYEVTSRNSLAQLVQRAPGSSFPSMKSCYACCAIMVCLVLMLRPGSSSESSIQVISHKAETCPFLLTRDPVFGNSVLEDLGVEEVGGGGEFSLWKA